MNRLPEPPARQPHATQAGQPPINPAAQAFLADLEDAFAPVAPDVPAGTVDPTLVPTSYRDPTPPPAIGTAPPVPQPGRPPMSQKATDASALMLSAGVASIPLGAALTGVLWASGHADPTTLGIIAAAPASLAIPILALTRLAKRAKETAEAAPPVHHHHYNGNVHQQTVNVDSTTRGLWARTHNQLPPNSQ